MGHNYYSDDYQKGHEDRLEYFDEQFKVLAEELALSKGITLQAYLSQIRSFASFKAVLEEAFSQDTSLANYVDGMKNRDFQLFYNREIIQDIVNSNRADEPISEDIIQEVPEDIAQENNVTKAYFKAMFVDYDTGKTVRTIAYKDEINVMGRKQTVYRDSKGRFTKRI